LPSQRQPKKLCALLKLPNQERGPGRAASLGGVWAEISGLVSYSLHLENWAKSF
jgi:hypothetical protein